MQRNKPREASNEDDEDAQPISLPARTVELDSFIQDEGKPGASLWTNGDPHEKNIPFLQVQPTAPAHSPFGGVKRQRLDQALLRTYRDDTAEIEMQGPETQRQFCNKPVGEQIRAHSPAPGPQRAAQPPPLLSTFISKSTPPQGHSSPASSKATSVKLAGNVEMLPNKPSMPSPDAQLARKGLQPLLLHGTSSRTA